jgi:hypothetical protein
MGGGCMDPRFLDLGTSWRWVVSFPHRPLYPRRRAPGTHWMGGWVLPEPVWTTWRNEISCYHRDSKSDPSVVQPVASRYTHYTLPALEWTKPLPHIFRGLVALLWTRLRISDWFLAHNFMTAWAARLLPCLSDHRLPEHELNIYLLTSCTKVDTVRVKCYSDELDSA